MGMPVGGFRSILGTVTVSTARIYCPLARKLKPVVRALQKPSAGEPAAKGATRAGGTCLVRTGRRGDDRVLTHGAQRTQRPARDNARYRWAPIKSTAAPAPCTPDMRPRTCAPGNAPPAQSRPH